METMTNEQAAEQYRLTHHSQADNDFQNAMNIAVWKAYVAACEWKDEQHKEQRRIIREHWQNFYNEQKQEWLDKACKWLKNANLLDFIVSNFKQAMEKQL